jgi:transcriptional regulator with XRE-family HTH domain
MDIGKRIRELREAKGMSQGDIERHSGLLRSYISRVEGGFTTPSLVTLEKFAEALDAEPYQLIFPGDGKPAVLKIKEQEPLSPEVKHLLKVFNGMSSTDRQLLLALAAKLAKS